MRSGLRWSGASALALDPATTLAFDGDFAALRQLQCLGKLWVGMLRQIGADLRA